ncbi:MAG: sugar porter family MFS transporter [Planctomycetales bacterium]|nr:sugar porter family MFS transporter [Planctomycetales bacterium]
MNSRLFLWALTSALAGFLFGFDTVVISGAEKTIQELWTLSEFAHGLVTSMALWGTVVGSLVGFWPTDHFGRKKTLLWIGILYFVSAVWSGLASGPYDFAIARFIGGLGVGISTVAAPLYISEISPPQYRGRLAGMFQFNIVFGILVAYASNFLLGQYAGESAWRWMLGIEAVPALIYAAMCIGLPESPRWLVGRRQLDAGRNILKTIDPDLADPAVDQLVREIEADSQTTSVGSNFWTARLRIPILLAFLIAFFNQLSGINAILYFAPRIFALTGMGESASRLNSIGIGFTNLIFTFVGLYLIDRLGRKTLLVIGSLGYIASLGCVTWAFITYHGPFQVNAAATELRNAVTLETSATTTSESVEFAQELIKAKQAYAAALALDGFDGQAFQLPENGSFEQIEEATVNAIQAASAAGKSGGLVVMFCIFAFIAAHAVGQGAVIWVYISEIFPNQFRATGQALGSFTHWIFAALITLIFPLAVKNFAGANIFAFFCGMMILQLIWVLAMVPETKGVPLEEVERKLGVKHG